MTCLTDESKRIAPAYVEENEGFARISYRSPLDLSTTFNRPPTDSDTDSESVESDETFQVPPYRNRGARRAPPPESPSRSERGDAAPFFGRGAADDGHGPTRAVAIFTGA